MLSITFIFFSNSISISLKKNIFSTVFYILSVILIAYLGAEGQGLIILICISVMITLFEGKQKGLIDVKFAEVNIFDHEAREGMGLGLSIAKS